MFEKTETNPITVSEFGKVNNFEVVNQMKSKSPTNPLENVSTSGIAIDTTQRKIKVKPPPISNLPQTFFGNLKNLSISGNTRINNP